MKFEAIKTELVVLLLAVANVTIISMGHANNNKTLLMSGFVFFMMIVLLSPRVLYLPEMLFYLPWSAVMKTSPGAHSFYTYVVPIFFIVLFLFPMGRKIRIYKSNLFFACSVIILTSLSKLASGYGFQLSYLMFSFMLICIPVYFREFRAEIPFESSVVFLGLGAISASFASRILMSNHNLFSYIYLYEWAKVGLVRTSGFYSDPNFYSAHILIAIYGLLIISVANKKVNRILPFSMIILLVYFGMQSVSKMFIITLITTSSIWFIGVLFMKGRIKEKFALILILAAGVMYILSSSFFSQEINYYLIRFGMVKDTATLTTGRSLLFLKYISYFKENPRVLLMGQGYTSILPAFARGVHNTLLQSIYQFGLLGFPIIVGWIHSLKTTLPQPVKINSTQIYFTAGLFIACFMPWMALDILFFDEFFYFILLFLIGYDHIRKI